MTFVCFSVFSGNCVFGNVENGQNNYDFSCFASQTLMVRLFSVGHIFVSAGFVRISAGLLQTSAG